MQYLPSPTALRFMQSRKFLKLICGPIGGGKSTVAIQALWLMALQQRPYGENKVRRTKFAILRNTSRMLKETVKPLIDYWFVERPQMFGLPALGTWRVTDATFEIRARLGDGTIVHTEFVMQHADTPDDVRRLLSAEYSGAWVEEAREIDPVIFEGLQGRAMRFPNIEAGGITYPCVICSTNPPPVGTYWHEFMTNPPDNADIFMQPAAVLDDGSINPEAENLKNLDPAYYPTQMQGKTEDWINVYLKNKFGAGGMGQPVFRATWRSSFHVAKEPLKLIPSGFKKVIVGSDNGLVAAAVIGQEDARGRINIVGDPHVPKDHSMGYDRFLDTILVPKLRDLGVPPQHVLFVVDPACFHRSQANEVTIAQVIARMGYQVVAAPTNDPERRITAVEGLLMQQIEGGPRVCVSPDCKHLINAMEWGYRNKKTAADTGLANPQKDWFANMGDAMQYFSLYFGGAIQASAAAGRVRKVLPARFAYT